MGARPGNSAATTAARLGAHVTLIEKDIVGGAAHLWDCIPSKAMIATGGAMSAARRADRMGLDEIEAHLDFESLRSRNGAIVERLNRSLVTLLQSQRVDLLTGRAYLKGPNEVVVETAEGLRELGADAILRLDRQPAPDPGVGRARRRPRPRRPATPTRRPSCPSISWSSGPG